MLPDAGEISFRPLSQGDIPLVYRWRCLPHVAAWFHTSSEAELAAKLRRRIAGIEPCRPYLILACDRPIGYIQTYYVRDWPEYRAHVDDDSAAALDLFIGEPAYMARGLGPLLLRLFLEREVFADSCVTACYVDPDARNRSAIRAYRKAGFRYLRTVSGDRDDAPTELMRIARENVCGAG